MRTKHCTRLHALLIEFIPGGIRSEITVAKARDLSNSSSSRISSASFWRVVRCDFAGWCGRSWRVSADTVRPLMTTPFGTR
jgi:hypothetical protein